MVVSYLAFAFSTTIHPEVCFTTPYSMLFASLLLIPVQLRADSEPFLGFFIQARAESNQESTASIVGVWTPLNTTMARTAICNGVNGVSYLLQIDTPFRGLACVKPLFKLF